MLSFSVVVLNSEKLHRNLGQERTRVQNRFHTIFINGVYEVRDMVLMLIVRCFKQTALKYVDTSMLNIAIRFKVTDALGEDFRRLSSRLSTKKKGTWTEKEIQINDSPLPQ